MNTNVLFIDLIDFIENEIKKNSEEIRIHLNKIKTLQTAFELELDEYNQIRLSENIGTFSNSISILIATQTELIEFYAKLSGYVLTSTLQPAGYEETALLLLDLALKHFIAIEDYAMCARIKCAVDDLTENNKLLSRK